MTQRVWLITGVSSGFGRHLSEQLLARGDRVIGTVRKPDTVKDLAEAHPDGFRAEVLDVRDTAALRDVVDRTVADFGRIDVAISNAGYGVFGAAEELSDEQIEAILATNLIASIQFIRAVLPHMRSAGGGRIIQMSTYGGAGRVPRELAVSRQQVGHRRLLRIRGAGSGPVRHRRHHRRARRRAHRIPLQQRTSR